MMHNPVIIADSFNQQNTCKNWKATPLSAREGDSLVQFRSQGLVRLYLNCATGDFSVKYNKVNAAWGDYISSIRRGLYVVLNTLESAGHKFNAPPTLDELRVSIHINAANEASISWSTALPDLPLLNEQQATEYQEKFAL